MRRSTLHFQFHAGLSDGRDDFSRRMKEDVALAAGKCGIGRPTVGSFAVDDHAYIELQPIITTAEGIFHHPAIAIREVDFGERPSDARAVDHALFGDLFEGVDVIIQVKGWGSGMRKDDWDLFLNPTRAPDFDFKKSMRSLLLEMLQHVPSEQTVVVQYDGDKIDAGQEFSRFTLVLPTLMQVLTKEKACQIKAVLATKLTEPQKAPEFANKCFAENGGEQILNAAKQEKHHEAIALYTVAFPTENEIGKDVRNAFGAYVNRSLPEHLPKCILLFGGGKVIQHEMDEGYDANTEIVLANVTRKGTVEHSPIIPQEMEAERLVVLSRELEEDAPLGKRPRIAGRVVA